MFNELDAEFHFTLDAASTDDNAKCAEHFTPETDGLEKSWGGHSVFCNPPYGRKLPRWVEKAHRESQKPGTTIVLLIPARTDTSYWHDHIFGHASEIRFLRGRVHFSDGNAAPFPSAVVVFRSQGKYQYATA